MHTPMLSTVVPLVYIYIFSIIAIYHIVDDHTYRVSFHGFFSNAGFRRSKRWNVSQRTRPMRRSERGTGNVEEFVIQYTRILVECIYIYICLSLSYIYTAFYIILYSILYLYHIYIILYHSICDILPMDI